MRNESFNDKPFYKQKSEIFCVLESIHFWLERLGLNIVVYYIKCMDSEADYNGIIDISLSRYKSPFS